MEINSLSLFNYKPSKVSNEEKCTNCILQCCHLQCYHINGCFLSVVFQHNRRTSLRKWTQIRICFPLLQKQLTNKHHNFQNKNGIFKPFKFHLTLPLYIEYAALMLKNVYWFHEERFFFFNSQEEKASFQATFHRKQTVWTGLFHPSKKKASSWSLWFP